MSKVNIHHVSPENSLINKGFGEFDYFDSFSIEIYEKDTIDNITTELFKVPSWVDILMKLRNFIVGYWGLKEGNKKNTCESDYYSIGSEAGNNFLVIDRNENEIVMAKDDKHLKFRTSFMKEKNVKGCSIYLTTIVKFNNIWGKIYFLPVKPFHKIIMKSLLKRI